MCNCNPWQCFCWLIKWSSRQSSPEAIRAVPWFPSLTKGLVAALTLCSSLHGWLPSLCAPLPRTTGRMLFGPSAYNRGQKLSLGMRNTSDLAFRKFSSTRWRGRFGENFDYLSACICQEKIHKWSGPAYFKIFFIVKRKTWIWKGRERQGCAVACLCSCSTRLNSHFYFPNTLLSLLPQSYFNWICLFCLPFSCELRWLKTVPMQ